MIRYSKEDQSHYKSGCKDIDKGALLTDIATKVLSHLYLLHSWVDHVVYKGCTKSIWHLFSWKKIKSCAVGVLWWWGVWDSNVSAYFFLPSIDSVVDGNQH